ncbi:MAG: hypothetical protein ACLR4Z_03685 [Butyricicoccaceae bacterium]
MQRAYDLLADELFARVFLDTVRFKLSGKLKYLRHSETGKDEVFRESSSARPQRSTSPTSARTTATRIRELLHYTDGQFAVRYRPRARSPQLPQAERMGLGEYRRAM